MKKIVFSLGLLTSLVASLMVGFTAFAAESSGPGKTSTGSMKIVMAVGGIVKVTGVNDITISEWTGQQLSGTTDPRLKQNLCIFSNNKDYSGKYQVTISDTSGAFKLTDPARPGSSVDYTMVFIPKGESPIPVTVSGVPLTNLPGSDTPTCENDVGGTNASLELTLLSQPTIGKGTYTGTINLTVTGNV